MRGVRVRGLVVAAALGLAAGLLATGGSAARPSATVSATGKVGAQRAACLAHVVSQNRGYYLGNCTGHDEPELDPVSSAPHSARDLTWHVALPADGPHPVSSVGPTFWFGGTVADSNPAKIGGQGFLELQIYPDSLVRRCTRRGRLRRRAPAGHLHRLLAGLDARPKGRATSSSRRRSTACSRTLPAPARS